MGELEQVHRCCSCESEDTRIRELPCRACTVSACATALPFNMSDKWTEKTGRWEEVKCFVCWTKIRVYGGIQRSSGKTKYLAICPTCERHAELQETEKEAKRQFLLMGRVR